jgi:hypothetical protein
MVRSQEKIKKLCDDNLFIRPCNSDSYQNRFAFLFILIPDSNLLTLDFMNS